MKLLLYLISILSLLACSNERSQTDPANRAFDSHYFEMAKKLSSRTYYFRGDLITDTSVGHISINDSFEKVLMLGGISNLIDDSLLTGIDTVITTYVNPNTMKEVEIFWNNDKSRDSIFSISLSYFSMTGSPQTTSYFITTDSMKLGDSVRKLIEANQKPIIMTFDNNGDIHEWNANNGSLKKRDSDVKSIEVNGIKYDIYLKDRSIKTPQFANKSMPSDDPALSELLSNLIVSRISVTNYM